MIKVFKLVGLCLFMFLYSVAPSNAQTATLQFGNESSSDAKGHIKTKPIGWFNVNTDPDTWRKEKD